MDEPSSALDPSAEHALFQSLALLERQPADESTGADPDDPATLLFLIQLAAKYHARGDQPRRAGICLQLHIPDHDSTLRLRQLLDLSVLRRSTRLQPAHAAVERLLDLADTYREHASGTGRPGPNPHHRDRPPTDPPGNRPQRPDPTC
jgi:hypothetical protein